MVTDQQSDSDRRKKCCPNNPIGTPLLYIKKGTEVTRRMMYNLYFS